MEYLTIIGGIKKTKDIFLKAGKIKEFEQILRLIDMVGEERRTNFALQEENQQLKKDIKQLDEKLKLEAELVYNKNHYALKDGVKVCSGCYDNGGKAIKLHPYGKSYAECPACKNKIRIAQSSESSSYKQAVDGYINGSEDYDRFSPV